MKKQTFQPFPLKTWAKAASGYPKTLKIKQTCNVDGKARSFEHTVKNKKEEQTFRLQAASMAPNYTNEITG